MNHVMVDLETLDLKPTAAILSIGAVRFNPETGEVQSPEDGFHVACSVEDQLNQQFSLSEATLVWWLKEHAETLRKEWALKDRVPIDDALRCFAQWLKASTELEGLWSHGANFDQPVLEYAYRVRFPQCDLPWKYSISRDTRTLFALAKPDWPKNPAEHVAVFDAWSQAKAVCSVWRSLKPKGKSKPKK